MTIVDAAKSGLQSQKILDVLIVIIGCLKSQEDIIHQKQELDIV